uniref:Lipoprotein n=1 Tax=Leptospirillum ferriphilum TaxID=178606 RepID=A0A2I2MFA6_9BACT
MTRILARITNSNILSRVFLGIGGLLLLATGACGLITQDPYIPPSEENNRAFCEGIISPSGSLPLAKDNPCYKTLYGNGSTKN